MIRIRCPNCKEKYLLLRKGETRQHKGTLYCVDCVYVYDEDFFENCPEYYKQFVERT